MILILEEMGAASRARPIGSARDSGARRAATVKKPSDPAARGEPPKRRPAPRRSAPRPKARKADARLRGLLFPIWRFALLVLVISLVLVAAGPTVQDPESAKFLTLAGWALAMVGILLLADELWIREQDRRRARRAAAGIPPARPAADPREIAVLRSQVAERERHLSTVRSKLRETRATAREPTPSPPAAARAASGPATAPASPARRTALIRDGSALASLGPAPQQEGPPAGVSLAVVPASDAARSTVAVFVRWNRYADERSGAMAELGSRPGAETFEFPLEGANDFHSLDEVSRVLGYRVAGHPSGGAGERRLVVVNLRLGEFDEASPRAVLVDNRALWHHAEGLLDRPEEVKEMLLSPAAETALRSLGAGLAVDRLAFSNEPLAGFLVREIASIASQNPALPVPRLVDVIVNRAFVASGKVSGLVDGLGKARVASGSAGDRPAYPASAI